MRIFTPIFFMLIALSFSCNHRPESLNANDYQKWISNVESGLVNEKQVNHVTLKATYLPAEYLAYKEFMTASDSISYDSILQSYRCGLTFQLSLSAEKDDPRYGTLNYYQISSQEELTARIQNLSFHAEDFISLEHNGVTYSPVLSNFEGFDELGNRINLTVVFQIPEFNCGEPSKEFNNVTLTLDDPYWDLGTNHFLFENKSITTVPKLDL